MNVKPFNRKIEQQSLEYANTHDMLIESLEGQVYLKEKFHKVNTNQVTGEALKKVSVGGKGGFGSQGDARDQDKQVEATSRVMVMSGPSQEAYDHNVTLKEKVVYIGEGAERIYALKDGAYGKTWCPSHIFGEKEIKGWVKNQLKIGRDYDEFVHSNQLDPADAQAYNEFFGIRLNETRALYDELCGYKNAWQYCRDEMEWVNGEWVVNRAVKARRYRFTVANLLNQQPYKKSSKTHVPANGYMTWEASSYNHHIVNAQYELYLEMNPNARKDCVQYVMLQLRNIKDDTREFLTEIGPLPIESEPSEEFLLAKAKAEEFERKRRFKSMEKSPELRDWRKVYNWELTKQGKTMFSNEKL